MLLAADPFSHAQLLWAGVAGAAVGAISGMFGIGGGFLLVPVLNIVLGVPMEFAVGAGACQVLGPATTSLLARRIDRKLLRLPLTILGGLVVGVYCGAQSLRWAQEAGNVSLAGATTNLAEVLVLAVYFVLLTSVGLFALWEVRRANRGERIATGWLADVMLPPLTDLPAIRRTRVSIPVIAWFGLAVGFLSGLLGMSGGLILLPGLIYLLGLRTQDAVSNSLVIVWIVACLATAVHAWNGFVSLPLVIALLFGGTIGARLGSELGLKLEGPQLRRGFAWLLLGTAGMIAVKALL